MNLRSEIKENGELFRIILFSLVFIIPLVLLFKIPRLAIPLLISYVLSLLINPIIPVIMKMGFKRTPTIIIVFIGLITCSVYPLVKVIPILKDEAQNIQYYIPKIETYVKTKYHYITNKVEDKTGIQLGDSQISDFLTFSKTISKKVLLNIPAIMASALEWIFVIPLLLFFILRDGKNFKNLILKVTPNSLFERFYNFWSQFNKQIGGYIFAKLVEASIVGTIITAGLLILDIRFSILLGFLAAVTNIIPYVGPILGMAPGIIIGLVEYGFDSSFWALSLVYLIANAIDLGIVFPLLVSKIVDLHPIVVVLSVILGSQFFGVAGMVISIPAAAAIKLLLIELYNEFYTSRF